jgi:plastocyanin
LKTIPNTGKIDFVKRWIDTLPPWTCPIAVWALLLAIWAASPGYAEAASTGSPQTIAVTILKHHFETSVLTVPPGEPIVFRVTNLDPQMEEFESYDMGFEVVVRPGQTVLIPVSGLGKGRYDYFGDFHPGTAHGTLTVN